MSALVVAETDHDAPGVAMPHAEPALVVRFGGARGIDLHVMGGRQAAHRKLLRGGQRTITARLVLGAGEVIFGASPADLAGRIVSLEALWGEAATRSLAQRLVDAPDLAAAAAILERTLAARRPDSIGGEAHARLALAAAPLLAESRVGEVAATLGVSERTLRRAFREAVGMGPKDFAKLARFQRALGVATSRAPLDWARIAATTGYYDQAHLIAEFREVAGVTPRALLGELAANDHTANPSIVSQPIVSDVVERRSRLDLPRCAAPRSGARGA